MKRWTVLASEYIWKRPWFALRVDRVETGRGAVLDEYPVIEARDWACIVAVTEDGKLVLVRQYRHGAEAETLELPAGGVDPDEAPERAARRELLEETGYEAPEWHHLISVSPEPTRRRHRAHLYLAKGAKKTSAQKLEPGEDVEVELRSADEAGKLVFELSHAVHIAALFLALERCGGKLD